MLCRKRKMHLIIHNHGASLMNFTSLFKNSIIAFFAILGILINLALFQNIVLGIIFGSFFLIFFGYLLGKALFKQSSLYWKISFGVLFLFSVILILGSGVYFFYKLDNLAISSLLIFISLGILFVSSTKSASQKSIRFPKKFTYNPNDLILVGCFSLLEAISFFMLFKSATSDALRSPWEVIPKEFFVIYFFATFFLAVLCFFSKKNNLILSLICVHTLLSVSVALIVYRLGYGFDPFIHRATVEMIVQKGIVTPKPFYYLGQYSLITILSKIFFIPVYYIDILLLPLLFSFYVPQAAYYAYKNITDQAIPLSIVSLGLLIFPYSSFIVTTPQGLANFFILMVIFFSLIVIFGEQNNLILHISILSISSVAIHPLSGIPALIFIIFILLANIYKRKILPYPFLQKFLIIEIFILSSIAIPIIFIINSQISSSLKSYLTFESFTNIKNFFKPIEFLIPYYKNNFDIIYDIVYWYEHNIYLILLTLAVLGAIVLIKKHKISSSSIFIFTFLIFFINYLILRLLVSFPSLIDYERVNYPNRILEISFYFLLPLILYVILFSTVRSKKRQGLARLMIIIFLSLFITSSLYISYPRIDEYKIDKGYNITQADIAAAHYINESSEKDYIVLANQMTSVAAIREFGFKKYYQDKNNKEKFYFYYPIPTGDPLYQYYLKMVYDKPKKEFAKEAGDFIGVSSVFFILNKYWDKYDELVENAKLEADSWQSIEEGKAHVFFYDLEKKSNPPKS